MNSSDEKCSDLKQPEDELYRYEIYRFFEHIYQIYFSNMIEKYDKGAQLGTHVYREVIRSQRCPMIW